MGPDQAHRPITDVADLEKMLSGLSGTQLVEFYEWLGGTVEALNTRRHQKQPVRDSADLDDPAIPLGDDAFLDARVAVALQGQDAWEAAASNATAFAGTWPISVANQLDSVIEAAYEAATGEPWPDLALDDLPAAIDSGDLPPPTAHSWLDVNVVVDGGRSPGSPPWRVLPEDYDAHLQYLEERLNHDPRWWHWWRDTLSGPSSTLDYRLDFCAVDERAATVQSRRGRGRDKVVVKVKIPWATSPTGAADDVESGRRLARDHMGLLFGLLQARLDITPPGFLDAELDSYEDERDEWQRQQEQQEHDERAAFDQHQRHRSSEHIWRGRAPDAAVDELIAAIYAGRRLVALPRMIADLRARWVIEPEPEDADRLAGAGYTPAEIAVALGPSDVRPHIPTLLAKKPRQTQPDSARSDEAPEPSR